MKFSELRLSEPILRAVAAEGYVVATPIQAQSVPHVLAGRDLLGCAQTGTGKTAAFALPILQKLSDQAGTAHPSKPALQGRVEGAQRNPGLKARLGGTRPVRCLVLCPTRELAIQIDESFRVYGRHVPVRCAVIFGGVNQNPQVDALRRGVDVLIATPGRLIDLMQQRHVDLRGVETLVLDEADRMLDMGFIPDIRRIVAQLPSQRQTLLFSATMPPEIRSLAQSLLRNPISVQVSPVTATVETVDQSVYFVEKRNKPVLLAHLYHHLPMSRAIVFTRTKHGADRVVRHLHTRGIRAEAIHGNKSQNARERALNNFRSCKTPILVATDIASRGIDIDGVSHVVNYDLTHEPETYVHRIGRTARAGASGAAVSFCDHDERPNLRAIEDLIRQSIPVKDDHPAYPAGQSGQAGHAAPQQHAGRRNQSSNRHSHQRPARAHAAHRPHDSARAPASAQAARHHPSQPAHAPRPHARHPLHGGVPRGRGKKRPAFQRAI